MSCALTEVLLGPNLRKTIAHHECGYQVAAAGNVVPAAAVSLCRNHNATWLSDLKPTFEFVPNC